MNKEIFKDTKGNVTTVNIKDNVNHPDHYNKGIETTDYICSWDMNFLEGNIVKYITRYKYKGGVEDLKKAQWYLEKLIHDTENQHRESL